MYSENDNVGPVKNDGKKNTYPYHSIRLFGMVVVGMVVVGMVFVVSILLVWWILVWSLSGWCAISWESTKSNAQTIAETLNKSRSVISHYLNILYEKKLVDKIQENNGSISYILK